MGKLNRDLNLAHALSIVVGTIIGTGIFLKSGSMVQALGSGEWVLLAWIVAGLVSFLGALAYGELAARFPEAGGEYAFLKYAYGRPFAFLFGWTRFLIAGPGSIAAYGVGAATFLSSSVPEVSPILMAICFILIFTGLNTFPVRRAGDLQGALTLIKFGLIFFLIFGTLVLPLFRGTGLPIERVLPAEGATWPGLGVFAGAVVSALWAYDGWNNLVMAAGEVKRPERNLPIALGFGFLAVLVLYLLVNLGYFMALPLEVLMTSFSKNLPDGESVGQLAYASFLGADFSNFMGLGAKALTAFALSLSALGAMNGSILTGARVPYAMGQDGTFFRIFAKTSEKGAVPYVSVLSQGFIAVLFAISGSFDQITDMVVFSSWIFYGACVAALFVLRRRDSAGAIEIKGYRMPGYPHLPVVFVVTAVILLVATWVQNFKESSIGLGLILLGLPFYFYCSKKGKT